MVAVDKKFEMRQEIYTNNGFRDLSDDEAPGEIFAET
jgi:hypothetical protein